MNVLGFVIPGILLFLFSISIVWIYRSTPGIRSAVLLAVSSLGLGAAGLVSLPNRTHHILAAGTFLFASLGIWGLRSQIAETVQARWLRPLSSVVPVFSLGATAGLWIFRGWAGLLQRAAIGALLGWIATVAFLMIVRRDALDA
jgi:hypothetical protein